MRSDLIAVLEAAYRVEATPETWMRGILDEARPFLDQGMGVGGAFFDFSRFPPVWSPVVVGDAPVGPTEILGGIMAASDRMRRRVAAAASRVGTASEATGLGDRLAADPVWRESFAARGVADAIGVPSLDSGQRGCVLLAALPRTRTVTPRFRATWSRIAAHIAAGLRLRGEGGDPGSGAAVLTPDGRVAHAEADASSRDTLQALRDGALQVDRARGRLRHTDPEEALALWQGLVAGRWSLVDHFDSDGKRFIVARSNDPAPPPRPVALTARERQVCAYAAMGHANKLIGYELGIATSTVGTLLARAATKLGVSSRAELIATFRALEPDA